MSPAAHAAVMDDPGTRAVERDLLATLEPLGPVGRLWIGGLVVVLLAAVYAYALQVIYGLSVTDMGDHVSWGLYMGNFVFFIGISHAGTLISAILRVTGAEWRRPITRMAEAITVFALVVGASMVIIDMGRPDRVLNVLAHGRLQSPILWDVAAISTYLTGSILYLYVAMVPDLAILARSAREKGRSLLLTRIYGTLSLGFQGTPEQWRRLNRALGIMAVIIIPVAISVHTVVSWIFGMTVRPGWHSTIFGPYFVIGAIFSGTAAIITAMAIFRRAYRLEKYLRHEHFHYLGMILLALTLLYAYFSVSEYLTIWYGGTSTDARLVGLLMGWTAYGAAFWAWGLFGLLIPAVLLVFPTRKSLAPIVIASVLINVGMWLKRYLIVVPTLKTPELPAEGLGITIEYFPTWVEWTITAGGLAAFLLLFTLFSRVIPILSIWETAEDHHTPEPEPEAAQAASFRRGGAPATSARCLALLAGALACALFLAGPGPLSAATDGREAPEAGAREIAPHALGAREVAPQEAGARGIAPQEAEAAAPSDASAPLPAAAIEIAVEEEGGEPWLIATVTGSAPVEGARVAFLLERTFGAMALGEDVTLDDGTAGVPFPRGLRGGPDGELVVIAEIRAPAHLAGTSQTAVVPGGEPWIVSSEAWAPRGLWASGARPELLLSIALLLLGVWGTYAFVFFQLSRIPGAREPAAHRAPRFRERTYARRRA
jgi:Ni/Fe-hydrogenase subunit HybB-like protein